MVSEILAAPGGSSSPAPTATTARPGDARDRARHRLSQTAPLRAARQAPLRPALEECQPARDATVTGDEAQVDLRGDFRRLLSTGNGEASDDRATAGS